MEFVKYLKQQRLGKDWQYLGTVPLIITLKSFENI